MEGVTGLLVMFGVLIALTIIGKIVSGLGSFLTNLEKQARERMKEMEAERRAQGGAGGPRRQQQTELEQLFQQLTGGQQQQQQRQQQQRQQQQQQPRRAVVVSQPPPAPARRPTRRIEPVLSDEGVEDEGDHGGALEQRHIHSRIDDAHSPGAVADRHIMPSISSSENVESIEAALEAERTPAMRMIERFESFPPLMRGLVWAEILGKPGGKRRGHAARRM